MFPWRIGLANSRILPNQRRFTEWLADHSRVTSTCFHFPAGNRLQFHSASPCKCSEKPQPLGGVSLLRERGPFVTQLKSRGVLRFDGPDTIKFLQGLVTNDLKRLEKPAASEPVPTPNQAVVSSGPIYAAMLNPQARFLYDLFFYRPVLAEERLDATGSGPGGDPHQPALLADVDVESLEELVNHLKKYRLRAKVEIQDVSQDIAAWQRFGGSLVDESNENKDADSEGIGWGGRYDSGGHAAAGSSIQGWRWFKDPRLTSLGFRGLFPSDSLPPLVEADKEVDEQYYLLWRLEEGVPEGPKEIPKGVAISLEYNLAGLNAISFEKGCYVGQELVARTHHRGVIRKRILPVNFRKDSGEEVQQAVAPKSEIIDADSGKTIGTVTTVLGPRGLALLRLEAALKNSTRLTVKGLEDVYVKVVRPKWWPSEWGHEEEQQAAVA